MVDRQANISNQAGSLEAIAQPGVVRAQSDDLAPVRVDDTRSAALQTSVFASVRRRMTRLVLIGLGLIILLVAASIIRWQIDGSPTDSLAENIPSQKVAVGLNIPPTSRPLAGALSTDKLLNAQNNLIINGNLKVTNQSGGSITINATNLGATDHIALQAPSKGGTICINSNNCGYVTDDFLALSLGRIPSTLVNQLVGNITLQGTTDEISVATADTGQITLSVPQAIGPGSSPTFAGLSVNGSANFSGGVSGAKAVSTNQFVTLAQADGKYALVSGDTNYIQNSTNPQEADFDITGSGTVGTDLAVNGNSSIAGGLSVAGGITATWAVPATTYYTVAPSPYNLTTFSGTSILLGDDGMSDAINLPFGFKFYGQTYHSIYICDNGYITFMPDQPCSYDIQDLLSANSPYATIYGVQQDLDDNEGGTVSYGTVGTAPSRTFIIFFDGVYSYGGDPVTFQIKLHETSWDVEIDTATTGGSIYATQGIVNSDGTKAKFMVGRNQANFSLANDGVIFTSVLSEPSLTVDTATGNVGIGLTSPTYELQVAGDVGINGDATIQGGINVGGDSLSYMDLPFDRKDYSTGTWPEEAVAADINNDGCNDVISGNYVTDNVSVMPGDCTGNFSSYYQYTIGSGARGTRFADFNGDGYQDIVTFNQSDNTVSVLINKGASGTPGDRFFPHVDYPAGPSPVYGATADINKDGFPDIVVPNGSTTSFSVLLNKGDGTFDAPVPYGSNSYTSWSARTGDLNGDGYPDVILTPYNYGSIEIFINKGASGVPGDMFDAPFELSNSSGAQFALVHDFNDDGKNDIAATIGDQVYIFYNLGDNTFSTPSQLNTGIFGVELAVADMDGDGIPDIVTDDEEDQQISILLGKSDGTFMKPYIIDALSAKSIYLADLNGDDRPDIIAANRANSSVSVFLNNIPYGSAHGIYKSVASISTTNQSEVGLIVQGSGSQNSDIFRVQNDNGDSLLSVGPSSTTIGGVTEITDGIDSAKVGQDINIGIDSGNADQINLNNNTLIKTEQDSNATLSVQGSDGNNVLQIAALNKAINADVGQLSITNSGYSALFLPVGTTTSNPTGSYTAGLAATWYNSTSAGNAYQTPRNGTLAFSGTDGPIDWPHVEWYGGRPAGVNWNYINAQWVGWIKADTTGEYTLTTTSDDGSRMYLAGTEIVNNWYSQGATTRGGEVKLTAGTWYPIEIQYFQGGNEGSVKVGWITPGSSENIDIPLSNMSSTEPNGDIFSGSFSQSAMVTIQTATGQTNNVLDIQNAASSDLITLSSAGDLYVAGNVCIAVISCTSTLGVTGNIAATGTITGGVASPDYAENIGVADSSIDAGTVVAMCPTGLAQTSSNCGGSSMVKATSAYSSLVTGVISTHPGFITNAYSANQVTGDNQRPLALSGRVPVKISNLNGPISVGDYLTSSSIPGVAMKATGPGPVIGVAMQAFTGANDTNGDTVCANPTTHQTYSCGKILFFINPSAANPGSTTIQGSNATFNQLAINGDAAINSSLTVAGTTIVTDLYINGHLITGGEAPVASALVNAGSGASATITGDDTSGTVTIDFGHATSGDNQTTDPEAGALAKIIFARPYGEVPQVTLTPGNATTANADWWRSASKDSFTINVTNVPEPDSTYVFDYFVRQ